MTSSPPSGRNAPPVRVNESIPLSGKSALTPAQIAAEKIPSPPHLVLGRELARGGMGHVHPATDRNLLRHVALKRIDKDYATQTFYRDGFIAEAQITGQLEHPNIVPIHELGIDSQKRLFFSMKMVKGRSLAQILDDLRQTPRASETTTSPSRIALLQASFSNALCRPR